MFLAVAQKLRSALSLTLAFLGGGCVSVRLDELLNLCDVPSAGGVFEQSAFEVDPQLQAHVAVAHPPQGGFAYSEVSSSFGCDEPMRSSAIVDGINHKFSPGIF